MCPSVCSYGYPLWVSVLLCLLVLQGIAAYSPPSTASHRERSTTHPSVCCRYYCIAYGGSYIPWDPMYPPEVGYLGSHGLWYPMDVTTVLLRIALHVVQC